MNYRHQAACRDVPQAIFFPTGVNRFAYREATAICHACPVLRECRLDILKIEGTSSRNYRSGMFGGWTAKFREKIALRIYGTLDSDVAGQGNMLDMLDEEVTP